LTGYRGRTPFDRTISQPFASCADIPTGRYVGPGYSGSAFAEPGDFHDLPLLEGQPVPRRYYNNPTRFAELRGGGRLG
jgi:hypothetical protein